jgi:hypothetical protein
MVCADNEIIKRRGFTERSKVGSRKIVGIGIYIYIYIQLGI